MTMLFAKFYKYFCNYKFTAGYTVVSLIIVLSIIGVFASIVIPRVSSFKAKGQQSEARIQLMKIYNSMYAHKVENGFFPDSKGQIVSILNFKNLNTYYRPEDIRFYNKSDNIYIISNSDQFVIVYIRILSNNNVDIQRLNSKKSFCHMFNGVSQGTENCDKEQIYSTQSKYDDMKDLKILKILSHD